MCHSLIMSDDPKYIVVIGASAGGINSLIELVSNLTPDMDAAFFVVLHLSTKSISGYLAHRLQQHTGLKCVLAVDNAPVQKGHLYVAVPNHHLMVSRDSKVKIGNSARENRWRPSIDILFRSAAAYFNSRAIGIVLTGLLNDGTSGMSAIVRSGGTAIVQDPNEAEYPDMPLSVLDAMEVDHCVPLAEMGTVLEQIFKEEPKTGVVAPDDIIAEADIAERVSTGIPVQAQWGNLSPYSCPECGGVLFKLEGDRILKYKCHTGHSFTERELIQGQSYQLEESLWMAIRSLEEQKNLLHTMADRYGKKGISTYGKDLNKRAAELEPHIDNLKKVLFANQDPPED
jgi:two-component system chemotaxis response regulator CheB